MFYSFMKEKHLLLGNINYPFFCALSFSVSRASVGLCALLFGSLVRSDLQGLLYAICRCDIMQLGIYVAFSFFFLAQRSPTSINCALKM